MSLVGVAVGVVTYQDPVHHLLVEELVPPLYDPEVGILEKVLVLQLRALPDHAVLKLLEAGATGTKMHSKVRE